MGLASFVPEVWHANLLGALQDAHVFANLCNRDYEGTLKAQGDTVRINSIGRPTVNTYTPNSTSITPEEAVAADQVLVADQAKYFSFKIDSVDQFQAAGDVMAAYAREGAYALGETADTFLAAKYTQADAANQLGTVSITTSALAFDMVADLNQKLNEASVPRKGRWIVIPPFVENLLLQHSSLVRVDAAGTGESLREAQIGRLLGFDVYVSNNTVNVTGDDYAVMAGFPGAITFAEQIVKTVQFQPEASFSEALKSLHVYGASVIQPAGLATCVASIT